MPLSNIDIVEKAMSSVVYSLQWLEVCLLHHCLTVAASFLSTIIIFSYHNKFMIPTYYQIMHTVLFLEMVMYRCKYCHLCRQSLSGSTDYIVKSKFLVPLLVKWRNTCLCRYQDFAPDDMGMVRPDNFSRAAVLSNVMPSMVPLDCLATRDHFSQD
jgi:hypothetical protein